MVTIGSIAVFLSALFKVILGSAFVGGVWKVSRFITRIEHKIIGGESTVNKMATNDLPHIHGELVQTNTHLEVLASKLDGIRDVLMTTRNS
ncbi:MAG TPA: hypothetical protein VN682_18225 [Terriglobales bacterium]|nr:hypothetical protein [Terriglobales bacterium]